MKLIAMATARVVITLLSLAVLICTGIAYVGVH